MATKQGNNVTYLHGDHLGSTSVTSGANISAQTYYAYGAVRTTSGTLPTEPIWRHATKKSAHADLTPVQPSVSSDGVTQQGDS